MPRRNSTQPLARLALAVAVVFAFALALLGPPANRARGQQAADLSDPLTARELEIDVRDGFTLATVGDLIVAYPASPNADEPFIKTIELIRGADVAFGNFELSALDLRRLKPPAGRFTGAREIAADLKALGFDMVARANNHLFDFGVAGILETNRALAEAGLVYAGSGPTLGAARAPRYFETPKGRVALVAMASSFNEAGRATEPRGEIPGRPGLSALRTRRYFVASGELMRSVRSIREAFPSGPSLYPPLGESGGEVRILGEWFRELEGAEPHFAYEMNEEDLEEILRSIRIGKRNADFLIATIHSHETHSPIDIHMDPVPGDFLPRLAKATIDNGADAFAGTGVHVLRGIEIYKGKPIFYGLGEFFRQMDGVLGPYTGAEPTARRPLRNSPEIKYESVVALSRFEGGKLAEIRLHPIDLGHENRFANRGVPRLASPEVARRVLARLRELSAPYGTRIVVENGIGIIRP